MSDSAVDKVSFSHVVLEGTSYDVGRQQGANLRDDPERACYLTPPLPFLERYSEREARRALDYFEMYCPGIMEEVQGAADAFGVSVADIAFLGGKSREDSYSAIPVHRPLHRRGGHCSHFVVLPPVSEDGHVYAGQNEDCGPGDLDLRLCTTRVEGKPAHIGFSDMIFGRVQGMNEHGFCVTTSWGAPGAWLRGEGLPYFAVVRALLDRCQTVDEALEALAELPIAWCTNFIVTDRSGEAALIEVAYTHRGMKRIQPKSKYPFLWATNHYTLPALLDCDTGRRRESVERHGIIESRITSAVPHVSKDHLRCLLSEPMPEGLCLHHYSQGLGTLWSMIFDVTDVTADICFGAPSSPRNPWRTFGLQDPIGSTEYLAHLPNQVVPAGFWERISPGSED